MCVWCVRVRTQFTLNFIHGSRIRVGKSQMCGSRIRIKKKGNARTRFEYAIRTFAISEATVLKFPIDFFFCVIRRFQLTGFEYAIRAFTICISDPDTRVCDF